MNFFSLSIFYIFLVNCVSGQAPGDHEERCRTGINAPRHHFPMEWRVLMDTYDYGNLLGSRGVWTSTSWLQVVGGSCSWQLTASSSSQTQSQNNWVFSQHISFEDANEIFFNVSVRIDECNNEPNCRDYVTLYRYYSDRMVSNAERINTNNYQPLNGTVEQSRLQRTSEQTLTLTRPADQNGFYLAVRDEGARGQFVRMIVYYVVCKSRVVGLVTYPQTAVPVRNSRDIVFDAMCAANAHNTTSLQVVASSSTSTCSDRAPGGAVCKCNGGYVVSSNGMSCQACGAGNYRSLSDTSCRLCPGNTVTDVMDAAECRCLEGFYRNDSPQEGPEVACTAPPSECRNIRVISRTSTAINVSWTRPTTTGRPDFFYRVQYSDPNNVGQFITVNDNLRNSGNEVTYTVSGLVPFTTYIVGVTTHNGVSDQDPDSHLRQCEVTNRTVEGIPGAPIVQQLCTAILWQPPSQRNGVITGYRIKFSSESSFITLNNNTNFHVTTEAQRDQQVTVQVGAVNIAGNGVLSPPRLVCPVPCRLSLTTISQTDTTINITWTPPGPVNGDILSYTIERRFSNDGIFVKAGNLTSNNRNLSYTLSGLSPFTTYIMRVNASNSTHIAEMCEIAGKTMEGVSSQPTIVAQECTVLVWRPPTTPNGVITRYEIEFSSTEMSSQSTMNTFYSTESSEQKNINFRIRAHNGAGPGEWTNFISNGCSSDGSSLFNSSNSKWEILIVFAGTFAATSLIFFVFIIIICCVHKKKTDKAGQDFPMKEKYK